MRKCVKDCFLLSSERGKRVGMLLGSTSLVRPCLANELSRATQFVRGLVELDDAHLTSLLDGLMVFEDEDVMDDNGLIMCNKSCSVSAMLNTSILWENNVFFLVICTLDGPTFQLPAALSPGPH